MSVNGINNTPPSVSLLNADIANARPTTGPVGGAGVSVGGVDRPADIFDIASLDNAALDISGPGVTASPAQVSYQSIEALSSEVLDHILR
ncbi:MAG: hypothetical protein AAFY22_11655 [Pseudomonadota bacterium]